MKKKNKKLPFYFMILCITVFLIFFRDISAETLISLRPQNVVLAIIFLLAIYVAKSFIIVFPIVVLYAAGGIMFPGFPGFLANLAGTTLCITVPYCIGRYSGPGYIDKLLKKYPKLNFLNDLQKENPLFFCYMARVIIILPADAVSLYLGACNIKPLPFIIGSLLGMLPGIAAISFLGAGITKPGSPEFMISFVFIFILTVFSFAGYFFYKRKSKFNRK